MNRTTILMTLILLSFIWSCQLIGNKEDNLMKLWYDKPAKVWEEALPLGNGRMGAMVFGNPATEHIQINEETVWAGEPGNNLPPEFKDVLPQVRKLIFDGKYKEAEDLTMTKIPRHAPEWNNYGMPYQTLGDIYIHFPGHEKYQKFRRELDIQNAFSSSSYEVDGVTYKRECFISAVDQVMMIKLTASENGKISCSIDIETPHTNYSKQVVKNELILSGTSGNADNKLGKIRFQTMVHPKVFGGEIKEKGKQLEVNGADELILYVSMGTNFKNYNDISGDETLVSVNYLKAALNKSYDDIKKSHISEYQSYFDRVELDLGVTDSINNPIDQRVKDFNTGYDPQLVSLYFQFGRYLLISSSRPGTQPANLQGIWNYKLNPPWDSKYTVNINTEMNYWPAEVTNLSEMHEPLFSMLRDLSIVGKETAKEMYGAKGWAMHHNTDLWRITGPVDGAFYGMWPMGGAWLSQHLWQRYLYSGDSVFLQDVYPILRGSAQFYADVLQKEPTNGWMVVAPCMSPENRHPGGASMAAGNTMDNQLVFDVFFNLMEASRILDIDHAFADSVLNLFNQLPPMQIGRHGQLQEWLLDWDRKNDHHRHVSHLYGLYPSNQVSPFSHPELFQAAKNSLVYRGDKSTGWSMGWKVNLWARLLDGNRAFKLIKDQLSPAPEETSGQNGGTYPNLFDAHPPFQIDGNFGCTSGIAEMLMQSHDGNIFLLPALPDEWKNGSVKGLRARGGFTIDMVWENNQVKELVVYSSVGGNCRIRTANNLQGDVALTEVEEDTPNTNSLFNRLAIKDPIKNENAKFNEFQMPSTMIYDFHTEKSGVYIFKAID